MRFVQLVGFHNTLSHQRSISLSLTNYQINLSRSSSDLLKEKKKLLESIIKAYLIDLTLCQPPTLFVRKNARGVYFKTNDKKVTIGTLNRNPLIKKLEY